MATTPQPERRVTVGIDSHKDVHVAAAVDQTGRILATTQAPRPCAAPPGGSAGRASWAWSSGSGSKGPAATPLGWPAG